MSMFFFRLHNLRREEEKKRRRKKGSGQLTRNPSPLTLVPSRLFEKSPVTPSDSLDEIALQIPRSFTRITHFRPLLAKPPIAPFTSICAYIASNLTILACANGFDLSIRAIFLVYTPILLGLREYISAFSPLIPLLRPNFKFNQIF